MAETVERKHLLRHLDAHLIELGYSLVRPKRVGVVAPEIVRISPTRGRIVYGEVVMRSDFNKKTCHERLVSFSQRRTRRRATILLFIGTAEKDREDLEELLKKLDIRSSTRGGHVHVIAVPDAAPKRRTATTAAKPRTASKPRKAGTA